MSTRHAILLTTAVLLGAMALAAPAMGARVLEQPPNPRPGELWEQYPLNPPPPAVPETPPPAASEQATPPPPPPPPPPERLPLPPGVIDESTAPEAADGPKELPAVVNALLLAAALLLLLAVVTPLRHALIGGPTRRARPPAWRARSFGRITDQAAARSSVVSVAERIADYGNRRSLGSASIAPPEPIELPEPAVKSAVWSTPPPRPPSRHALARFSPAFLWALGVLVVVVVGLVIGVVL